MKNENGFTLIEMLVVLLIISVLLLITIPNITKSNEVIDDKSCQAFIELVESQVQLYKIANGYYPADIQTLADGNYLKSDQTSCPNGKSVSIGANGSVEIEEPTE